MVKKTKRQIIIRNKKNNFGKTKKNKRQSILRGGAAVDPKPIPINPTSSTPIELNLDPSFLNRLKKKPTTYIQNKKVRTAAEIEAQSKKPKNRGGIFNLFGLFKNTKKKKAK